MTYEDEWHVLPEANRRFKALVAERLPLKEEMALASGTRQSYEQEATLL